LRDIKLANLNSAQGLGDKPIKSGGSGAKGHLLKDVSLETLVDGIKTVHQGKTLIQPAITEHIIQGLKTSYTSRYQITENTRHH
jgi:DNA-binding NarL/FixJ family response regulator